MCDGRETVDSRLCEQHDAAAVPAVTAIGASARNKLLAAKTETAMAAVTGRNMDFDSIDKHGSDNVVGRREPWASALRLIPKRRCGKALVSLNRFDDVHPPAIAIELDDTIHQRKESEIRTLSDTSARMEFENPMINTENLPRGTYKYRFRPGTPAVRLDLLPE